MKLHYRYIGVLIAVILIAVSACTVRGSGTAEPLPFVGTTAPDVPPVTETVPAEPVDVEPPRIDLAEVSRTAYLVTMSDAYPYLSEAELLDFAMLACDALAETDPPDYLGAAMAIAGKRAALDNYTAGAVVGAVTGSGYC